MTRIRSILLGGTAALAVAGVSAATPAGADSSVGTQVLDLLCAEAGGQPVFTPMTIARCQDARSNASIVIPSLICEGLLAGDFQTVASASRPGRTNWFCFKGGPAT